VPRAFPDPIDVPADFLPEPDAAARAHGAAVAAALALEIDAAGGWLTLEAYLRFVLYAPGLGYYVAGARKFGAAGDFVTAPELSPLFGAALAVEVAAHLLRHGGDVIELGAGTGRLAADLLRGLDAAGAMPRRYAILEVSPDLRERQRETLAREVPAHTPRVEWIDALPVRWDGVVVMNEVLDAVPPHVLARREGRWFERGVARLGDGLAIEDRPLGPGALRALGEARFPERIDYASEVNPAAEALVEDLGRRAGQGTILAIDYGFPRGEYYHPQRASGTLMGHYRHRAHADPLLWPGLSDLTAHVDFTAIAEAGVRAGLSVAGFATQAGFLLSCGILDRLAAVGPPASADYVRAAAAVQKLLSPAEMGELFKVLALATDAPEPGPGFRLADMRHRL
jgi:SAM-dependent MidA family methyltransferase